ncbi:hypothetical protein [Thauera sinica]|uniref:hypothetical protein n=1 Tax=Thauera sp. K11 TaxID=2005884 RepID=UPI0012FD0BC2|nr:hypothetical protein [Thauera sp. K11]
MSTGFVSLFASTDSSEVGSAQNITVNIERLAAGDIVKLYMDGVQIGTRTADATDVTNGYVTLSVGANAWGADGERVLSATAQRGASGTVVSSLLDRHVYVAAEQAHWSAATGYDVVWFDPDALSYASGATVESWTTSVATSLGTFTVSRTANATITMVDDLVSGHRAVSIGGDGGFSRQSPTDGFVRRQRGSLIFQCPNFSWIRRMAVSASAPIQASSTSSQARLSIKASSSLRLERPKPPRWACLIMQLRISRTH